MYLCDDNPVFGPSQRVEVLPEFASRPFERMGRSTAWPIGAFLEIEGKNWGLIFVRRGADDPQRRGLRARQRKMILSDKGVSKDDFSLAGGN
jgi:hypothetical protein